MIEKQPSCDDIAEPGLLPVAEARERLFAALTPSDRVEKIAIRQSLHRVLAQDVVSPVNVPSQANSAMDGFAIHRSSIPEKGEQSLHLLGTAWAGQPYQGQVGAGEAVRIFTGAVLPEGADTVVIQEHAHVEDNQVHIDDSVVAGKNVRLSGEDIESGQVVLCKGRRLEAADIGVLASLGIGQINVICRLKVAFFTTGDELQSLDEHIAGTDLPAGMLFDSNRYTLAALLERTGVELIDLGIIRDNEADTRDALLTAADRADLVITSGGVSAGDADYVTRAFHDIGNVSFWKLAMRPGRPLAFGYVKNAAFFGLPGNPVAVMITFLEFVQPAIKHLYGMRTTDNMLLPAVCQSVLRKSAGRVEYQRGIMSVDDQGQLIVESTGKQGAGRLSSMSRANCLIVIDAETDGVKPGDRVGVQPFHGLLDG